MATKKTSSRTTTTKSKAAATKSTTTATKTATKSTAKTPAKAAPKPAAKSTTRTKTATTKTPAVKKTAPAAAPAPAPAAPAVKGVSLPQTAQAASPKLVVKKKELFERIKARATGVKGRDVRAVLDATLTELGEMLVAGETVNAPPLGTVKVQRQHETNGAAVVTCRLRHKKGGKGAKDPLAKAAE